MSLRRGARAQKTVVASIIIVCFVVIAGRKETKTCFASCLFLARVWRARFFYRFLQVKTGLKMKEKKREREKEGKETKSAIMCRPPPALFYFCAPSSWPTIATACQYLAAQRSTQLFSPTLSAPSRSLLLVLLLVCFGERGVFKGLRFE